MRIKDLKVLLMILAPFLIIYIFSAFVSTELNPFKWSEAGRVCYIAFSSFFAFVGLMISKVQ